MDTGRWLTPIEVNMARTNRSHTKIRPDTDRYLPNSQVIVNKQKCRTKEMDRVDGLTDLWKITNLYWRSFWGFHDNRFYRIFRSG